MMPPHNGPTMGRNLALILITILLFTHFPSPRAQNCRPTGYFRASGPPPGKCPSVASGCCQADQVYFTFQCSPDVTSNTTATLANDTFFGGGGALKCGSGGKRVVGEEAVVALSTGWFDVGKRCGKVIIVSGNGRRVRATVVGECDSTAGCDAAHGFRAPCGGPWASTRGLRPNLMLRGQMLDLNVSSHPRRPI